MFLFSTCTRLSSSATDLARPSTRANRPWRSSTFALAWVIDPSLFVSREVHVDIETHAEFSAGRTVVDLYDVLGLPKNARVLTEIDAPRFWDLIVGAVASYR